MRVGIIGCGLIGNKRAAALQGTPHSLEKAFDVAQLRVNALVGKYGGQATSSWQEVVASDLDVIIVATTHDKLAEISLAAIDHGKHVLVEKPAGLSASEVLSVIKAAERNQKFVKVGFNHRFHPAISKAHQIVSSGALGELMYIRGRYGHGGRLGYEKEWRCDERISGGGELIDQGAHLIDLSRWFLGDMGLEYAHNTTYFWNIGVEDNCFLALTTKTGQMAWLHATWTEWKNCFSFEIYGKAGKLKIDGLGGSYGVETLTYYKMLPEMGIPQQEQWTFDQPDTSWENEFKNFSDSIKANRQPIGNIYDALALHGVIEQAYGKGSHLISVAMASK